MILTCVAVLCLARGGVSETSNACAGTVLWQPAATFDDALRGPPEAYVPQAGDVILSTDHSKIICAGHCLAGSKGVHHSSIMFIDDCGRPAVLEAGPFNGLRVEILDPTYLLAGHEARCERVWVRRRCVPLTPDQSTRLTQFAVRQNGKRFAAGRMCAQLTIFRSRGPWTEYCGLPHGERSAYFCAELVMESCVAAGVVDPTWARPTANYPRDFFLDRSSNKFLDEHPPLACGWAPPARWTTWRGDALSPSQN
jgi:hypothetical protein